MRTVHDHTRMIPVVLAFLFCLGIVSVANAAVTADPASLVFKNTATPATLQLTAEGAPIPAQDIHSFRLMVNKSDYSHMFQFSKADGSLTLTPSKTIEVGSYDLVISTSKGEVTVKVYTPLSDQQSTIETLAKKMNLSTDEFKRQTGMTREFARQQISLNLEPVYYVGTTLNIDVPVAAGGRAVWMVNGETVVENAPLAYTFKKPGSYLVTYKEFKGDIVTATTSEIVEATDEPETPVEINAGVALTLSSPEGFGRYNWTADGQSVSLDAKYQVKYDAPGTHRIELTAEEPVVGPKDGFRHIVYALTVNPAKKP